jgi:hypothetical protein
MGALQVGWEAWLFLAAGVFAGQGIPSDYENVDEHLDAVSEHAYFRGWGMAPADGDFRRPQAVVAGQIQELGVETEALDGLLFENDSAGDAAEGFEAALGVYEWQAQDQTDNLVEDDASEFAEMGLMHGDLAAIHGAGADGDFIYLHGGKEFFHFFDGGGKIGVGE